MERQSLLKTLMKLGYTRQQAEKEIERARNELQDRLLSASLDEAYNICEEFWGLEPDYIEELL